ncbi:hypothetical protein F4677DRAFT_287340 [Hypoxylon crocopeplum]|nr:hypothetical protein F4677DRAFT_287340 [Hypoxylon crocopeplum]
MGGNAFSSGDSPLYTPRMTPAVYQHVLNFYHAQLQQLFVAVATPIPGPAKKDHGDVDIFLAWERNAIFPSPMVTNLVTSLSPSSSDLLDAAKKLLNAERALRAPHSTILAIPWPEDLPEESPTDYQGTPRYIQVDLHLCDTLEHLQWMLFRHAHGDLWSILGSTIRPFGLTIDEVGLHLRVPKIEFLDRKKAKILLTTEPKEVLDFLGLSYSGTQWEEPFASAKDLFEYVATCRLFCIHPLEAEPKNDKNGPVLEGEINQAKLKASHRRRLAKRPVFREFFEEFLPACRDAGLFTAQTATRDSVCVEAFNRFPGTRVAYAIRSY